MKPSKSAISSLFESMQNDLTLRDVKNIERKIEELKNLCLGEEIIQPALTNAKRNDKGNICCPFCGSPHIKKNGHNRHHKQVYFCLERNCSCKNFTITTNSILYASKKPASSWIKFMKAYLDQDTLSVCADKANISKNTAFFWRQKINFFFNQLLNQIILKDEVELDETVCPDNQIGTKCQNPEPKHKKRGMSNDKVNIATAIDTHNNVILKASVNGRITTKALLEVFTGLIEEGTSLTSDSLRSYHKFMKEINVKWIKIESGKKEKDGHTLDRINHLHDGIKTFLGRFRGVSKRYLQGYLAYFNLLRIHRHHYHDNELESILTDLFSASGRLRYKDILDYSPIYA